MSLPLQYRGVIRVFIESRTLSLRRTKRLCHDNPGPVFHLRQGSARCCVRPRTLSLCCSYFAFLRGVFFLLLRLLRSFERESRKNCDVILYRSIDSRRNFFRRRFFATMMAKKRPINRSIVVLPVAWSFLEWSDAISLSLSLSLLS